MHAFPSKVVLGVEFTAYEGDRNYGKEDFFAPKHLCQYNTFWVSHSACNSEDLSPPRFVAKLRLYAVCISTVDGTRYSVARII